MPRIVDPAVRRQREIGLIESCQRQRAGELDRGSGGGTRHRRAVVRLLARLD